MLALFFPAVRKHLHRQCPRQAIIFHLALRRTVYSNLKHCSRLKDGFCSRRGPHQSIAQCLSCATQTIRRTSTSTLSTTTRTPSTADNLVCALSHNESVWLSGQASNTSYSHRWNVSIRDCPDAFFCRVFWRADETIFVESYVRHMRPVMVFGV